MRLELNEKPAGRHLDHNRFELWENQETYGKEIFKVESYDQGERYERMFAFLVTKPDDSQEIVLAEDEDGAISQVMDCYGWERKYAEITFSAEKIPFKIRGWGGQNLNK